MEGDTVTLQDAFLFDYSAGVDADGRFLGRPRARPASGRGSPTGSTSWASCLPPGVFGDPRPLTTTGRR